MNPRVIEVPENAAGGLITLLGAGHEGALNGGHHVVVTVTPGVNNLSLPVEAIFSVQATPDADWAPDDTPCTIATSGPTRFDFTHLAGHAIKLEVPRDAVHPWSATVACSIHAGG